MKISIPGPQTQTPQRVHFSSIFFISPNLIHKRNLSPLSLSPSLLSDSPFLFISSRSNSFFFYPLPPSPLPLSFYLSFPLPTAKSAVPFLLPHPFLSLSLSPRSLSHQGHTPPRRWSPLPTTGRPPASGRVEASSRRVAARSRGGLAPEPSLFTPTPTPTQRRWLGVGVVWGLASSRSGREELLGERGSPVSVCVCMCVYVCTSSSSPVILVVALLARSTLELGGRGSSSLLPLLFIL